MVLGGQGVTVPQKHYWCYWSGCLLLCGRAGWVRNQVFMAVEILQVC